MCGIIGYTGNQQASPILLAGLSRLEYRGYDSAGLAIQAPVATTPAPLQIIKTCGHLQSLTHKIRNSPPLSGCCGIGHTRWATHGIPSEENAHPHLSEDGHIAVVHNGIIENHHELRRRLQEAGITFRSQTDTEVIPHLLSVACHTIKGQDRTHPKAALIGSVLAQLKGAYALGILFSDEPDTLYAVRHDSPLLIGCITKDGQPSSAVIASDAPALLPLTRQVYYPRDGHIIKLTPQGISFFEYDEDTRTVRDITPDYGDPITLELSETAAQSCGYQHFMRKEIEEAPKAVRDTLQKPLQNTEHRVFPLDWLNPSPKRIHMIACGSAYHACLAGKSAIESLCHIPVDVEIASEFRYRSHPMSDPAHTPAVFVSQSGETADTIAALRLCKTLGMPTLGIVNVRGSTLAKEADHAFYTQAGPEIAVATTKAYCAQVAALLMAAIELGQASGALTPSVCTALQTELSALPEKMSHMLTMEANLRRLAQKLSAAQHMFFIGRGMDHATAMEGSLKLKEVSYIHAEAYAAGELKHGTLSLIEEGTPVVALLTQPHLLYKTLSNMAEVKARGAYVVCLTNADRSDHPHAPAMSDIADDIITLPPTHPCFSPLVAAIPLQLLAYHVGVSRALNPDKPRNLAKSVTVE